MRKKGKKWVIGADEAGRGPLAGPVTVGAILAPANFKITPPNSKLTLKDSKKLTKRQREEWFRWIKKNEKEGRIFCATANVSPKTIDRINISRAADRAAARAIQKVVRMSGLAERDIVIAYLDGGLYPKIPNSALALSTCIRADETIPVVSLASIAAKVTRDSLMDNLERKYPGYGFAINKGYGTRFHSNAIAKLGCSSVHRKTFLKLFRRKGGIAKAGSI